MKKKYLAYVTIAIFFSLQVNFEMLYCKRLIPASYFYRGANSKISEKFKITYSLSTGGQAGHRTEISVNKEFLTYKKTFGANIPVVTFQYRFIGENPKLQSLLSTSEELFKATTEEDSEISHPSARNQKGGWRNVQITVSINNLTRNFTWLNHTTDKYEKKTLAVIELFKDLLASKMTEISEGVIGLQLSPSR